MSEKKILISTIVYGEYINWFETVCLRSLFQSGNIPALIADGKEVEHVIYTRDGIDIERLKKATKLFERKGVHFVIRGFSGSDEMIKTVLVKEIIKHGIERDLPTLFINPDIFVANGSLKNITSYQYKGDMCIAALHVRVETREFLDRLENEGELNPRQLVSIAMDTLHPSWSQAFTDQDSNVSYTSCSTVQKIKKNMWVSTLRIPTAYWVKFRQSDLDIFSVENNESQGINYGMWDHTWPAHLMEQHRYKFVGCSDFFFAVELTNLDDNRPQLEPDMLWNDECHNDHPHSEVNRNFSVVLNGKD